MSMRITFERFPNDPLVAVNVDGERVGTYRIVDGGFVPQGRTKPVSKETDARYLVVAGAAAKRIREANRYMESVLGMFMKHEPMGFTDDLNDDGEREYSSWTHS